MAVTKYRLGAGMRPHKTMYGGIMYEFDDVTYREYPQALLSMFHRVLVSEKEQPPPKPVIDLEGSK